MSLVCRIFKKLLLGSSKLVNSNSYISCLVYATFFLYFRWTVVSPDPLVSQFSPCQPDQIPDICLYLEDSVHYDLLVREDSRLALQGTVSKRLEDIMKPKLQHVPEQSISSPALRRLNLVQSHSISPMNFPACPKGRGRPKVTKRQGAPIRTDQPEKRKFNTQQEEEEPFSFVPDCLRQFSIPQPPKKRGRPKGSKNKEQTKRTLVETSCDPEADVSFLDSGDLCEICGFALNASIKKGIAHERCKICNRLVHSPCLLKSGCTCQS